MPVDPPPSPLEGRFTRALNRLLVKLRVDEVPHIKRIVVTVVGGTVLIFGAILVVTPGPAVLVMPVGLAILGTEYAWARRWLRNARKLAKKALSQTQKIMGTSKPADDEASRKLKPKPAAVPVAVPTKPAAAAPPDDEHPAELAGSSSHRGDASLPH